MGVKTIVITGGNTGLGFATAERIANGHRVVLACRDPQRSVGSVARLIEQTGNPCIEARELDLASLASVRKFAEAWGSEPIDALVLNAGVQVVTGRTVTKDGYESTFAVNHLGHFLLANLLLPKMASEGRVVSVSSDTHDPKHCTAMPSPRFEHAATLARGENDPRESPGHAGRRRYTTSKLCNVLCAYEMHRRIQSSLLGVDRRISVNVFDPGLMPTGLRRDYSVPLRRLSKLLPLATLAVPNANLVSTSASRLARLILDERYKGVSGCYISRGRVARSSDESYDETKAFHLWEESSLLVGLTAPRKRARIGLQDHPAC